VETLADIKNRAAVGARLTVIAQTRQPELVGTTRTITRVLPDGTYRFTSSHTGDEEHTGIWPHPIEVNILDDRTFEYVLPRPARYCIIRLRFEQPRRSRRRAAPRGQVAPGR
jgi:hypothetical protein